MINLLMRKTFILWSTVVALSPYSGEKQVDLATCARMNGSVIVDSCIFYVQPPRMTYADASEYCIKNGGRVLNLPNETYIAQYAASVNYTGFFASTWLGMSRIQQNNLPTDFVWSAGNDTYPVEYNNFNNGIIINNQNLTYQKIYSAKNIGWITSLPTVVNSVVCQHVLSLGEAKTTTTLANTTQQSLNTSGTILTINKQTNTVIQSSFDALPSSQSANLSTQYSNVETTISTQTSQINSQVTEPSIASKGPLLNTNTMTSQINPATSKSTPDITSQPGTPTQSILSTRTTMPISTLTSESEETTQINQKTTTIDMCKKAISDDPCIPPICYNGGTCMPSVSGYTCVCPAGFSGHLCSEPVNSLSTSETADLTKSCDGVMYNGFCYSLTTKSTPQLPIEVCHVNHGIRANEISVSLISALSTFYGSAMPTNLGLAAYVMNDECGVPKVISDTSGNRLPLPAGASLDGLNGCATAVKNADTVDIVAVACSSVIMELCRYSRILPAMTTTEKPHIKSNTTNTTGLIGVQINYEDEDAKFFYQCLEDADGACTVWSLNNDSIYLLDLNKVFTNFCRICITNNTIMCSRSTNYTCKCRQHYIGLGCELLGADCRKNTCQFGKCKYNDNTASFDCICDKGFTGLACDQRVGLLNGTLVQIIGQIEHSSSCIITIVVLSMTVLFQLLFDRTVPFGYLKLHSNIIMLMVHIIMLLFHNPITFELYRTACNFVALAISFMTSVYYINLFVITTIAYRYISGCVIATQTFPIPRFICLAWLAPCVYYVTVACFYFDRFTMPWYCLPNMAADGWAPLGAHTCIIMLFLPFFGMWSAIVAIEAFGHESWCLVCCQPIVNKQQLLVALLTRAGYLTMYPLFPMFGLIFSSYGYYYMNITFFTISTGLNIAFACFGFFWEVLCHKVVYYGMASCIKSMFGFIPMIRIWEPHYTYNPEFQMARENVTKFILDKDRELKKEWNKQQAKQKKGKKNKKNVTNETNEDMPSTSSGSSAAVAVQNEQQSYGKKKGKK